MPKKDSINHFEYLKEGEEIPSKRTILTTYVPDIKSYLVRGIDVSDLSSEEQKTIERLWQEYKEYLTNVRKTNFSFEDYIQHTTNQEMKLKWRSFHPEGIQE